jgi:hypothetical protein
MGLVKGVSEIGTGSKIKLRTDIINSDRVKDIRDIKRNVP